MSRKLARQGVDHVKIRHGNSSASRSANHRRDAAPGTSGSAGYGSCCKPISVWPHAVFSQRATCRERRRTTALDRTHHLQLAEAHIPRLASRQADRGRGRYPRPRGLVEPFRRLWRRRLLLVPPRRPAARFAQGIERTLDRRDHSDRHMTVAGCRLKPVVPEQSCNLTNILAALKQMGCEAVA